MSARILVVDDNPLNVKLLAAKLARDYYFVSTAENGLQALQKAQAEQPDLILLDIMMPEMDGFEACTRLKADPRTTHIPVIMITALSDTSDRVHGLEVGADDFLTKPINDTALMARVRSLLRLKMMMDEWRLREATAAQLSFPVVDTEKDEDFNNAKILLLEDDPLDQKTVLDVLASVQIAPEVAPSIDEAQKRASSGGYDLLIASLDLLNADGLFLCAQLRALESTRTLPILLLARDDEIDRVAKGLDLGANDYLLRPLEGSELIARTRIQLRQKRHYDHLRQNYEQSLALALVDPLTGAYNRRYLDIHLPKVMGRSLESGRPLSVLSFDLDHFKHVNDTYGHQSGDVVLKSFVAKMMQSFRPTDLVVRLGGEEFAVIMPDAEHKTALSAGERLRKAVEAMPIPLPGQPEPLFVTTSIGAASLRSDDTMASFLNRADEALYRAKETGRNKVVGDTDA